MTRRAIRENIFLIVFKAAFNSQEDMEEQIRFSVGRIGEPEDDPEDIAVTEAGKVKEEDLAYIDEKSHKILAMIPTLDEKISEISDGWQIGRLGKPELAILRLALYEMLYDEEVPFRVAINEAVELAKKYCNPDASGFINAVLAKVEEP
ncbi:transcription antitermination factor NusB [Eubacterium sp. MSJ-33]|uniref:transcription antitermination factor NusB n=1 Tax=Eubacterium sp. MSJ-33 TaxID=2841528 RepID=UPI001C78DB88|nr:transcription antitermination factor NusB [Eubacterium sp. MSJ-33]QWT53944.1 transcription antitermination factor NusB [Eubacterium sp. MSJ-33]